ncbi:MAG: transposase [Anaerolineae bacterium]|nr:transposase [Anaerolineae bacterium]
MNRTYEYRLYPRKRERAALEEMLAQGQAVYNAALQECKNYYTATGKRRTALAQWDYFREWRKQPGITLNASSLQQVLRRVDKAYTAFFSRLKKGEKPGHPRFKSIAQFKSLEYTYGDGCKLVYDEARQRMLCYVQNVGDLKLKQHRPLPEGAVIKHVILKRKASGWYVFLQMQLPDPKLAAPNGLPAVGADMGLLRLLTLSDGTQIDNPRWLRHSLDDLRRAQRRLARAQKGGQNRKDKRLLVAKLHEHIANTRRDFWHKLTYWLVHTYGLLALEHVELAFMTHNRHLSLSAHDAALGVFQEVLCYKAVDAGCTVALVNPAYTSQHCSGCGAMVKKDLSVRVHQCPHCSLTLDRDENAARNILALALMSARIEPSGVNVDHEVMRSLRSSPLKRGEWSQRTHHDA